MVHDDNIVGSRILAEAIGVLNVVVENFDDVDVVFVPAKWIGGDAQKTKPNSIQEERNDVDGRVEECTNNGISRGAADGILLKLDYVVAQDGGDAKDVEDQSGCENQQFRDTLTWEFDQVASSFLEKLDSRKVGLVVDRDLVADERPFVQVDQPFKDDQGVLVALQLLGGNLGFDEIKLNLG